MTNIWGFLTMKKIEFQSFKKRNILAYLKIKQFSLSKESMSLYISGVILAKLDATM